MRNDCVYKGLLRPENDLIVTLPKIIQQKKQLRQPQQL